MFGKGIMMKAPRTMMLFAFLLTLSLSLWGDEESEQMLNYYRSHSLWTNPGEQKTMFDGIPDDIPSIVKSVQGVLIHGGLVWLYRLEPSEEQNNGFLIRRIEELLRRVKILDNSSLTVQRPNEKRLVVNCRQFAVLTCSILRHKGIPARARAGYALYTWGREKYENHWICEYWNKDKQKWIQVDAQIDDRQREFMHINFNTLNMPEGKFVNAGEGWKRYRDGKANLKDFGLGGKDGWNGIGWDMVMQNVTCDAMALNKKELLPWDVNPYWQKKREEMSELDMETIEKTALLCRQVNNSWTEMREFYENHPVLHMPEDFEKKEQTQTAEQKNSPDKK